MASEAALLWSYLHILTKERYEAILGVYGSLEEATRHLGEELLEGLGCRRETIQNTLVRLEEFDCGRYGEELRKRNIRFLELSDLSYPSRLREIGDPPPFLYARGDLAVLDQPCIGLVGTRRMTPYGRRVAGALVPDLTAAGMVTVSGLAEGIDAVVARETLEAGGRTVAVLGHGLGMIYPAKHTALAEEVVSGGGLLLSEFPLDWEPGKYTFPSRNRIIAGLSLGTVVLEAPEESGALITADLAAEYGREVFAVPGPMFDPSCAGCHRLLRGGAHLVRGAKDILQELGIVPRESAGALSFVPGNAEEEKLFAVLTSMPQDVDVLVERSGMNAARINAALTMMELAGGVKNVGGGQWVKG